MRDIEFVSGNTPEEFAGKYRSTCRKIAQIGTVVDHYIISPTQAHIFYEFEEAEEEVKYQLQKDAERTIQQMIDKLTNN